MARNPILHQLGFADEQRVVILHADDLGMCQATVQAFAAIVASGLACSGSVMTPCPAFPQMAAYCRAHPDVDMGVHLTLTSEYATYRWGPLSTSDPASGLLDAAGYLPRRPEELRASHPATLARELLIQLQQALVAGIDVTHLDLHMGCLMTPTLLPLYLRLACETRLPALVWHPTDWPLWGFNTVAASKARRRIAGYQRRGQPIFDHVCELPLDRPQARLAQIIHVLETLEPGLTLFYTHPALDTPELRAITPDWPSRVADFEALQHPALHTYLRQSGIHLLSYRHLRDAGPRRQRGAQPS